MATCSLNHTVAFSFLMRKCSAWTKKALLMTGGEFGWHINSSLVLNWCVSCDWRAYKRRWLHAEVHRGTLLVLIIFWLMPSACHPFWLQDFFCAGFCFYISTPVNTCHPSGPAQAWIEFHLGCQHNQKITHKWIQVNNFPGREKWDVHWEMCNFSVVIRTLFLGKHVGV